jgi:hypothetical protein
MIQLLYQAICRWIDLNAGEQPMQVRVQPFVMRALEADLELMATKHDPKCIGGFKVAGIPIAEDPMVFFAEVDRDL